jgi:hypothetical protein
MLTDFVVAFALMIFVLVATAGLGVVVLLEIPVGLAVIASFVLERRRRAQKASSDEENRARRRR